MLYTKFQGHRSIGSGEEDFLRFLPYTLQRRYNAGDGSHKIEPRYKWYRAITTSALSAPPTNPKASRLPVRTMYLTITR